LKGALDESSAQALRNQSAAMIGQLLADTAAQTRSLPLEQVFDVRGTARLWTAAATLSLLLLGGALRAPDTALAFVLRHLGRDVSYPRATTLLVELPPASADLQRKDDGNHVDLVLPSGADLHVSVLATGTVPDEVFLDRVGKGGDRRSDTMVPRPGG